MIVGLSQTNLLSFVRRLLAGICLSLIAACTSISSRCSSEINISGIIEQSQLLDDLSQLSADHMQGREVATLGSRRAQQFISQRFAQIGLASFRPDYVHRFNFASDNHKQGANLIGWLPGSHQADNFIVVTAHYDHLGMKAGKIFNGADDNASGVAAMLSLAVYLTKNKPAHSVIFVATDAEETGLFGAKEFVNNPPVAIEKIKLNINLDMVAQDATRKRLYIAGTRKAPELKQLAIESAKISNVCLKRGHDGKSKMRGSSVVSTDWADASDHSAFRKNKIPYIYFGVDLHKHYHQHSDDFATIDPMFFTASVETIIKTFQLLDAQPLASLAAKSKS